MSEGTERIFTEQDICTAADAAIGKLSSPEYSEYFRDTHDLARMEDSISSLRLYLIKEQGLTVQALAMGLATELLESVASIKEKRGNTSEAEQEIRECVIISTQFAVALGIKQQFELVKQAFGRSAAAATAPPPLP